jgi:hypothetical protein
MIGKPTIPPSFLEEWQLTSLSRGCYDTPGLYIARLAHVDLEGLCLDSKVRKIRDQMCTVEWVQSPFFYCLLSVRAFWLTNTSSERNALQRNVLQSRGT